MKKILIMVSIVLLTVVILSYSRELKEEYKIQNLRYNEQKDAQFLWKEKMNVIDIDSNAIILDKVSFDFMDADFLNEYLKEGGIIFLDDPLLSYLEINTKLDFSSDLHDPSNDDYYLSYLWNDGEKNQLSYSYINFLVGEDEEEENLTFSEDINKNILMNDIIKMMDLTKSDLSTKNDHPIGQLVAYYSLYSSKNELIVSCITLTSAYLIPTLSGQRIIDYITKFTFGPQSGYYVHDYTVGMKSALIIADSTVLESNISTSVSLGISGSDPSLSVSYTYDTRGQFVKNLFVNQNTRSWQASPIKSRQDGEIFYLQPGIRLLATATSNDAIASTINHLVVKKKRTVLADYTYTFKGGISFGVTLTKDNQLIRSNFA